MPEEQEHSVQPVYVNQAGFGFAMYDLHILFRLVSPPRKTDVAHLVMSWPHAKKFAEVLNRNIERYERLFGPIRVEPDPTALEEMRKAGEIVVEEERDADA